MGAGGRRFQGQARQARFTYAGSPKACQADTRKVAAHDRPESGVFEYMPELHWRWSYPVVWLIMLGVAGGMMIVFHRQNWLGGENENHGIQNRFRESRHRRLGARQRRRDAV